MDLKAILNLQSLQNFPRKCFKLGPVSDQDWAQMQTDLGPLQSKTWVRPTNPTGLVQLNPGDRKSVV